MRPADWLAASLQLLLYHAVTLLRIEKPRMEESCWGVTMVPGRGQNLESLETKRTAVKKTVAGPVFSGQTAAVLRRNSRMRPPAWLTCCALGAGLTENQLDSLNKLPWAERLGDVIIGPNLESHLLVNIPSLRG